MFSQKYISTHGKRCVCQTSFNVLFSCYRYLKVLAMFLSFNEINSLLRAKVAHWIHNQFCLYGIFYFLPFFHFGVIYIVTELPLTPAVYSLPLSYSPLLQHHSVDPGTNYCA